MEFHHEQECEEDDDEEMPLPINTTYGHNNIVPLSLNHHKPSFIDASNTISPPTSSTMEMVVKYKECLRNHAASMGGKARDGCGEFMPCGEEGTLEALTCAVCNCHRNFHRKEVEGDTQHHSTSYDGISPHIKRFDLGNGRNFILQGHNSKGVHGTESLGYNHVNNNAGSLVLSRGPPPMIMPYNIGMGMGRGLGIGSFASESDHQESGGGEYMSIYPPPPLSAAIPLQQAVKKRFRTKFTQEQKEKMLKFAESSGWKIQRQEESVVQDFCQEIGIKRRVLKVWMHNNKQNLAKNTNSISINPATSRP
ncbi:hypothetical protein QVD17_12531 [Tagetes erecta]|uniref:ZF-HD dimerization-type domain-containing protein n=1 Tax=Tagetes erecta TaxID=13708 RepID=A0AAD8KVZ8_TARER|nr:hypothetical protein QVD17_12531 [Tagetes erecta]